MGRSCGTKKRNKRAKAAKMYHIRCKVLNCIKNSNNFVENDDHLDYFNNMETKRKRSPNFTAQEIDRLVSIVRKFSHTLEDKTTSATIWKAKENAWKTIAEHFNDSPPSGILRTLESLKKAYDNKKETIKKRKIADERTFLNVPGSLEKVDVEYVDVDRLGLPLNNQATADGLPMHFSNTSDNTTDSLEREIVKIEEYSNISESVSSNIDCDDITNYQSMASSSNSNLCVRRGSVIDSLKVSEDSKGYSELVKIKIEHARLEKQILEDKIANNRKESQLRLRGMELDNLIKEAQLRKFMGGLDEN